MPYYIFGNNSDGWEFYNRYYEQIGSKRYKINIDNHLINDLIKFGGALQEAGPNSMVFLFDDSTNPFNNPSEQNFKKYFSKIKKLSKLKKDLLN